ncbi:MAG: Translation elongation factor P [Candidatus Collierbacteria bacterium GW2011_GWC1_45_47]|nr:MAG: Translation elongation factor P [Candidatus Collierbacteria bacterium GW2011_GWC1_45_47]
MGELGVQYRLYMIDVNKLKVGVTFTEDNQPFRVMKYDFTKMGRGNAVIKIKAKNLFTGSIVTKSFISGNVVENILLDKKHLQYLYKDDSLAYFMDPVSFDQFEIPLSVLGDDVLYLVEGEKSWVLFWGEKILGVELPASTIMEVAEAEPGARGNTVSNVLKPVKMTTGLTVMVPLFINVGDKIKINTESGAYTGRSNE